jgi:hypothetical protein
MDTSIEALRSAVLSNNTIWLRSFGCKVHRTRELMTIQHSVMSDYNACIILSPPHNALNRLKMLLSEINHMSIPPNIYVDEESINTPFHSTLTANGYMAIYNNTTIAGVLNQTHDSEGFSLKLACINDFDIWVSLYSKGFGRDGKDADIDRSRWDHTFRSQKRVSNWFFLRKNTIIGICQTCKGNGVEGIYSFTIDPLKRNLNNLRGSLRALHAKLTEKGKATIYLELLGGKEQTISRGIYRYLRGLKVIRKLIGYSRVK